MAKKKVAVKKVKPTKRPAAQKSKTTQASKAAKSAAKAKPAAKPASKSKAAASTKPAAKTAASKAAPSESLGRPLVTQEEKLYMLFHEDYEARSVFEFLRVETVGDLVQLSADEIFRVLTAPVRRTVNRIRQRLAEKNRSLHGDEEFTRQHQAKLL